MRINSTAAALLAVIVAGCVTFGAGHEARAGQTDCSVSAADQAWIDRALIAWRIASLEIAGIGRIDSFPAVFFSADCVLTSRNALTETDTDVTWQSARHRGTILLPNGDEMPAGVTSFTSANDDSAFFVMSTPSVWRDGGIDGDPLGLENLMVAVLLHEGSHVVQSRTYGAQITKLEQHYLLPESFGDDSMQLRFEGDADFSASISRETELFFQAAAASNDTTALRLAREARNLMRSRAARWFNGDEAYWRQAEDIWLTFEGSGQWTGYQWLVSGRGAAMPTPLAMAGFARRSKWWSQNEGLAIALTLDRLGGPAWKQRAFGDGTETILEMLDAVLAE